LAAVACVLLVNAARFCWIAARPQAVGRLYGFQFEAKALSPLILRRIFWKNCDLRNPASEMGVSPFLCSIKCHLVPANPIRWPTRGRCGNASEIYSTARRFRSPCQVLRRTGHRYRPFSSNEKVQTIPGIHDTRTIITFNAFYREVFTPPPHVKGFPQSDITPASSLLPAERAFEPDHEQPEAATMAAPLDVSVGLLRTAHIRRRTPIARHIVERRPPPKPRVAIALGEEEMDSRRSPPIATRAAR